MTNLPSKPSKFPNSLTCDWKMDELINELKKRSIEITLGVDATTRANAVSFNIRHRSKDKQLILALIQSLFGTVKQG